MRHVKLLLVEGNVIKSQFFALFVKKYYITQYFFVTGMPYLIVKKCGMKKRIGFIAGTIRLVFLVALCHCYLCSSVYLRDKA